MQNPNKQIHLIKFNRTLGNFSMNLNKFLISIPLLLIGMQPPGALFVNQCQIPSEGDAVLRPLILNAHFKVAQSDGFEFLSFFSEINILN